MAFIAGTVAPSGRLWFAPMPPRRRIAALAVGLALICPAGAFAQGAGDNQYQDPFAGEDGSGSGSGSDSSGSGGGGGGGGGGGSSSSSGSSPSNTAPGTSEQAAAQTATPAGELARTGADPGLVALLGLGFVLTGAGLRVRVRRPVA
jgi:hypothetical protein